MGQSTLRVRGGQPGELGWRFDEAQFFPVTSPSSILVPVRAIYRQACVARGSAAGHRCNGPIMGVFSDQRTPRRSRSRGLPDGAEGFASTVPGRRWHYSSIPDADGVSVPNSAAAPIRSRIAKRISDGRHRKGSDEKWA